MTEYLVPVTLSPLQKSLYKAVLSKNAEILATIAAAYSGTKKEYKRRTGSKPLRNILTDLRKVMNHPYLLQNMEPELDPITRQRSMIEASGKLSLLKKMLDKLREDKHRVLIFSFSVMALYLLEEFCLGEGIKCELIVR